MLCERQPNSEREDEDVPGLNAVIPAPPAGVREHALTLGAGLRVDDVVQPTDVVHRTRPLLLARGAARPEVPCTSRKGNDKERSTSPRTLSIRNVPSTSALSKRHCDQHGRPDRASSTSTSRRTLRRSHRVRRRSSLVVSETTRRRGSRGRSRQARWPGCSGHPGRAQRKRVSIAVCLDVSSLPLRDCGREVHVRPVCVAAHRV